MKKYEKKFKIYLLILLLFIVVISASAVLFIKSDYFALEAKNYLSSYFSLILKKQVTIKKIEFSIFSPQIKFYGLSIKNFAKIKRIHVSLGPFNLFRRKIIIYKINVINPDINILVKNNKVVNYKDIGSVIKAFTRKSTFPISASFDKVQITGGNLNLAAPDKNILLKLKEFDFTVYKKPEQVPFLYGNSGVYFKYKMPHIYLKYGKLNDKLKLGYIFSSNAAEIHYFNGFIKYRKISFGNAYFSTVSGGILYLKKKIKISEIIKKINDTTSININRLSLLSKNITSIPSLKGKLTAKLTIKGGFPGKIKAGALIHLKNVVFSGGDIKNGIIECSGNFGRVKSRIIKFKNIDLNIFEGSLKSRGSINLKERDGKFESTLKNINIGKLIEFYDSEKVPQFKALADGNVTTFLHFGKNFYAANIEKIELNKPVQQFKSGSGKGAGEIYRINYKNKILIKGETLINDNFILLKNVYVSSRILRGFAEGEINYVQNYLNIGFNSTYEELPAVSLIEENESRYFEPSGRGTIKGNIFGRFHNISFSFKNKFKSLYIDKYMDMFKGTADVDIMPDERVLFRKVSLKEKDSGFNKKGLLAFNGEIYENKISGKEYINANFNAKNIHIISRKPSSPVFLAFNSQGRISGELKNPVADIKADSKNASIYGQDVSDINLEFLLTKYSLKIKKFEGLYGGANFNAYGSIRFKTPAGYTLYRDNYNLWLISNNIGLENLNIKLLKKYRVGGAADVNLHIGGSFDFPDVSGNASVNGIYVNGSQVGNISVGINSYRGKMALNISAFKNALKTKAVILLRNGYPYNFYAGINSLNIDYRKTIFGLSGDIYGNGKLSEIKKSYVSAKLDYLYLKHGPFFLKNTKNIKISYMDGTAYLSGFELKGGNNYFQIRGGITPQKYDIILNDRTDLWVLGIFSDKIINSSGFITASAVIFGSPASPRIYGFADIKRGFIEPSADPQFAASRIFAGFSFNSNVIVLKKARFRMLGGIFSTRGIIRLKNFKPAYYNVISRFNSAVYRKSNYFYAKMSGMIGYSGNADNPVLYGDINIKKALYDKKINLSSFLLSYKKYNIVKPMIKKGAVNPRLNIRITSDNGIAIKNNIINTDFSAQLYLIGTLYDPILMGTADAERGEIYFRGTTFKLSHADLDFNNQYRINPSFDVAATTNINEYIIRINASGSLLNFNVNLSSSPPLSETDVVSMLALGAPTTSVYAGSAGGIAAAEAASAIGGGVEQNVTGAISSYFGFNNLSVAPSYSAITHSAAPQVTVTKTITKNLSASYSDIASSQSSQSANLTYKLSRHVSIVGTWENNELAPNNSNVYSEVGGDIVFHFRFY